MLQAAGICRLQGYYISASIYYMSAGIFSRDIQQGYNMCIGDIIIMYWDI